MEDGDGAYWVPKRNGDSLTEDLSGAGDPGIRRSEMASIGDVVFDCGANIGVYTRVALAAGAKLVVAIEPAPENVECLRPQLRGRDRQGRVIVVPKGVWDREDVLTCAKTRVTRRVTASRAVTDRRCVKPAYP